MRVLVIDVGRTHIKVLLSGESEPRKFPWGPTLTAEQMVAGVKKIVGEWKYDAVSIGCPGDFEEDSMGAGRTEWRSDEAGIESLDPAVPHEEARHRAPRTRLEVALPSMLPAQRLADDEQVRSTIFTRPWTGL